MGKQYLFFSILGLAAVGLASYLNRQKKLLSSFGYKIKNATYLGSENGISTLEFKVEFTNTADFNIKVNRYEFDLIIDGKVVAKSIDNKEYNIPAKQSIVIPVIAKADTNLSLSAGIATIIDYFVDKTESSATLKGNLDVRAGIVTINNLPLDYTVSTSELTGGKF